MSFLRDKASPIPFCITLWYSLLECWRLVKTSTLPPTPPRAPQGALFLSVAGCVLMRLNAYTRVKQSPKKAF